MISRLVLDDLNEPDSYATNVLSQKLDILNRPHCLSHVGIVRVLLSRIQGQGQDFFFEAKVKTWPSEAKAKTWPSEAKAKTSKWCPRGSSRPRPSGIVCDVSCCLGSHHKFGEEI